MALGISGYIPKSTPKIELVQSIRAILEGEVRFPKRFHGNVATRRASGEIQDLLRQLSRLTSQQLRVLDMICRGLQNKHIAYELDITVTTVKVHVTEILRKLGVRSRTNAIIKVAKTRSDPIRTWRAGSRSCFGTYNTEPSRSLGQLEFVQQVVTSIERRAGTASRLA